MKLQANKSSNVVKEFVHMNFIMRWPTNITEAVLSSQTGMEAMVHVLNLAFI